MFTTCIWLNVVHSTSLCVFQKLLGPPSRCLDTVTIRLINGRVGGWPSGQCTPCCWCCRWYCHCIVLTMRRHDVYTISHPRKATPSSLPPLGGLPFRLLSRARVYHGGDNSYDDDDDYQLALQGGIFLLGYRDAGFSSPLSLVNASRERPIVTCAPHGCRRLTSIFYQCRVTLCRFSFSPLKR